MPVFNNLTQLYPISLLGGKVQLEEGLGTPTCTITASSYNAVSRAITYTTNDGRTVNINDQPLLQYQYYAKRGALCGAIQPPTNAMNRGDRKPAFEVTDPSRPAQGWCHPETQAFTLVTLRLRVQQRFFAHYLAENASRLGVIRVTVRRT